MSNYHFLKKTGVIDNYTLLETPLIIEQAQSNSSKIPISELQSNIPPSYIPYSPSNIPPSYTPYAASIQYAPTIANVPSISQPYIKLSNITPSNTTSNIPSNITPSNTTSNTPFNAPSNTPFNAPSNTPFNAPSNTPFNAPSNTPFNAPSNTPSNTPFNAPSNTPFNAPSNTPFNAPSNTPSNAPSNAPSIKQLVKRPTPITSLVRRPPPIIPVITPSVRFVRRPSPIIISNIPVVRPPSITLLVIQPSIYIPPSNIKSNTPSSSLSLSLPEYALFLDLKNSPDSSLIKKSSDNLVYNSKDGLTFTDQDTFSSSNYLTIEVPTNIKRAITSLTTYSMTVCFNLYLNNINTNTNPLRIFTQGDKSVSLSQYNSESIKIYLKDGKLGMDITTDNQTSTTIKTNTAVLKNKWYFIAYTINVYKNNTVVSLFINTDNGPNIATEFESTSNNSSILNTVGNYNNNYSTSVTFPRTIVSNKMPSLLYNDFQIGDSFKQDGFTINGNVRYFSVFNTALNNNQLKFYSNQLDTMIYIPPYTIYAPLTSKLDTSLIRSSSNNLVYDLNNGLTFTDHDVVGSTNYLTIPVPTSIKTGMTSPKYSMTVCFNVYLSNYRNINALRIFTQGDKSVPLSQYNSESIKFITGNDNRISMDITTDNQISTTIRTNTNVLKNKWYFIAYTIDVDNNDTVVSLFINTEAGPNIATEFVSAPSKNGSIRNTQANNNNNTTSVTFPRMYSLNNTMPALLYNDFQIGDRFKQDGFGMNGNIRNFIVFNKAYNNDQLKDISKEFYINNKLFIFSMPVSNNTLNTPSGITDSQEDISNLLINMPSTTNTPSATGIDSLLNITSNQFISVTLPLPNILKETFTNTITYPVIAKLITDDPSIPMMISTTIVNTSGYQSLDITQLPNSNKPIILIVPSLVPGSIVEIGGINILRGNGSNGGSNLELSIDNGDTWNKMGILFNIENKTFKLSGIGSPVIFTVTNKLDEISTKNVYLTDARENISNLLINLTTTSANIIDALSNITLSQDLSVILPLPNVLKETFTNKNIYPVIAKLIENDPTIPIMISTTNINTSGYQSLDITQIPNSDKPIILIVPSLIEDSIVEIGGIDILRGGGSNGGSKLELNINNSSNWDKMGILFNIGNKTFKLSGIGSPVIFTVTNKLDEISTKNVYLADARENISNLLINLTTTSSTNIIDTLSNITLNQDLSVILPLPNVLKETFTNKNIYPVIAKLIENDPTIPMMISTTKINTSGYQSLDITQIPNSDKPIILIVPSLIEDSIVEIGGIDILRGNGSNGGSSSELNINNDPYWDKMGVIINTENKTLKLSGIGSPVIFTVTNKINKRSTQHITDTKSDISNLLINLTPSPTVIDEITTITLNQDISVTLPLPDKFKEIFSNNTTYPRISALLADDPSIPMIISTTTINTSGYQSIDITQIPESSNPIILIVPSLVENSIVEIGGIDILRGGPSNGGSSLELNINNSENWDKIGVIIDIGNKTYKLSGIGGPVIFTVVKKLDKNSDEYIANTQANISKSLIKLLNISSGTNKEILNIFSNITSNQDTSVTLPLPDRLKDIFSNESTYPVIANLRSNNPSIPMMMSTTTVNESGNQSVDITKITTNENPEKPIILIVPSLVEGTIVEIGGINILRGNGSNGGISSQLSIDNGIVWYDIGLPIDIQNKTFILSGIGSPVIFAVSTRIDRNPVTILDYIFKYSYFFSLIGAILLCITTFIDIDAPNIFMNKGITTVFNIYIVLCSFVSLYIWLKLDMKYIISDKLFDQNVVVTRII